MATVRQHKKKLQKQINTKEERCPNTGLPYEAFENVPDVFKIQKGDKGKRVWLAGEYKTKEVKLDEIKPKYFNVLLKKNKRYKAIYKNEAILHPSEIDRKRLEEFDYKIKDGRKV